MDRTRYNEVERKIAEVNELFLEFVNDGMTREELQTNIDRRPELWGRFSNWLPKLPTTTPMEMYVLYTFQKWNGRRMVVMPKPVFFAGFDLDGNIETTPDHMAAALFPTMEAAHAHSTKYNMEEYTAFTRRHVIERGW